MSEVRDFGWQSLPRPVESGREIQLGEALRLAPVPEDYAQRPLEWKFAANMHAALETQYRILMTPPPPGAEMDLLKLQGIVAKDCVKQAIELGHNLEKDDQAKLTEIIEGIRAAMDEAGRG